MIRSCKSLAFDVTKVRVRCVESALTIQAQSIQARNLIQALPVQVDFAPATPSNLSTYFKGLVFQGLQQYVQMLRQAA